MQASALPSSIKPPTATGGPIAMRDGRPTFFHNNDAKCEIRAGGVLVYRKLANIPLQILLIRDSSGVFEDIGGKTDVADFTAFDTAAREADEESNRLLQREIVLGQISLATSTACYVKSSKYMLYIIEANAQQALLESEDFGNLELYEKVPRTVHWVDAASYLKNKLRVNPRLRSKEVQTEVLRIEKILMGVEGSKHKSDHAYNRITSSAKAGGGSSSSSKVDHETSLSISGGSSPTSTGASTLDIKSIAHIETNISKLSIAGEQSPDTKLNDHTTALAFVISEPNVIQRINSIREIHDKVFKRWMPHVNFLYPFLSPVQFETIRDKLAALKIQPFEVMFDKVDHFLQGSERCTVHLRFDLESEKKLYDVFKQIEKLFIGGEKRGNNRRRLRFTPHLTLGQCDLADLQSTVLKFTEALQDVINRRLPFDELQFLHRSPETDDKMVSEMRILFTSE